MAPTDPNQLASISEKAKSAMGVERLDVLIDAMQRRMDLAPYAMRARRRIVKHPFGTIKSWTGNPHLLMRRLRNVKTEIGLHVLAYNMKRVMQILGIGPLMLAMRT